MPKQTATTPIMLANFITAIQLFTAGSVHPLGTCVREYGVRTDPAECLFRWTRMATQLRNLKSGTDTVFRDWAALLFCLNLAHLARCAAAILRRADADIVRLTGQGKCRRAQPELTENKTAQCLSVNLPDGVLHSNHIAARRFHGAAGGVLGRFCPINSQHELALFHSTQPNSPMAGRHVVTWRQ